MTQILPYEDEANAARAAGDGIGRRAKRAPDQASATTRVDVQAARRQSSVRRRPPGDDAAAPEIVSEHARDASTTLPPPALSEMPGSPSPMPPPTDPNSGDLPLPVPSRRPLGERPQPAETTADAPDEAQAGAPAPPAESPPARPAPAAVRPVTSLAAPTSSKNQRGFNKHVCPFCGTKREETAAECPHCGMMDSDETRAATVARIGPWFLLQPRNPSAPGMRFSVLRELVRSGQVLAGSVVRGPTTSQLWTYAARVRGLGYLYGICWSCNRRLPGVKPGEEADDFCLYCGALQEAPANPDQQLEVLSTAESAGASPSPLAGQVNQVNKVNPVNPVEGDAPRRGVEIHKTGAKAIGPMPMPTPGVTPRRINTPRPLPAASGDGGDALLSTRELATAFNLDRRRTLLGDMGRFPWRQALLGLLVLAFVVVGLWVAASVLWTPILKTFGGGGGGAGEKAPAAANDAQSPPPPPGGAN